MTNEWNGSLVMEEFAKIAKEQGFLSSKLKEDDKNIVGNPKTLTPVQKRYEATEEYGVTNDKCIIEQAHPNKKVQMAESQGEGGVVENAIEQQEKDIAAATNMPTGALIGVHANLINELVKLANQLDAEKNYKAAMKVDQVIRKLSRPFDQGHLYKESWVNFLIQGLMILGPFAVDWWQKRATSTKNFNPQTGKVTSTTPGKGLTGKGAAIGAAVTGLGLLGALGSRITSLKEGIKEDTQDLFQILQTNQSPSAKAALKRLTPFANIVRSMDISTNEKFDAFIQIYNKFVASDLNQLEIEILKSADIEDPSLTAYGGGERLKEKFKDFKDSMDDMQKLVDKVNQVKGTVSQQIKQDVKDHPDINIVPGVQGLQSLLIHHGFMKKTWNVEPTGELDDNTINAARELENMLQEKLAPIQKEKGIQGSAKGMIISQDNQLVIDPKVLLNFIDQAELKLAV